MKRVIRGSVTSLNSTNLQSEYEYRRKVYLERKHEFETLGEEGNNDVLSREEKMNIAKAEMDKVAPKSVKSAKDATFKTDKRLSPTSERYKGYLIVLDRGGDGYNVYDKYGELEDAGYPSRKAAKECIDSLIMENDQFISSATTFKTGEHLSPIAAINDERTDYEIEHGITYTRSYSNKYGDQISIFVYDDDPDKQEYGEGGPSGDYFRGRWTQNMQDYYTRKGFKLDSTSDLDASNVKASNDGYNPYSFMVGDQLEWSGLYGGQYKGVVTNVNDEYVTVDVMWTSEDSGDTIIDTQQFEIATDPDGKECIIVWTYGSDAGYVYPPSNDYINSAYEYDVSDSDDALWEVINDEEFDFRGVLYVQYDDDGDIMVVFNHSISEDMIEPTAEELLIAFRQYGYPVHEWDTNGQNVFILSRGSILGSTDTESLADCPQYKNAATGRIYSKDQLEKLFKFKRFNGYEGTLEDWVQSELDAGYLCEYGWKELASKSVEDSDGFNTDYTLYTNGETYICMFGDKDLYEPDASYADYETENEQDAWDWFNSYTGFADEEDGEAEYYDTLESTEVINESFLTKNVAKSKFKSINEGIDGTLNKLGGPETFRSELMATIEAYPGIEDDIEELADMMYGSYKGVISIEELESAIEYMIDDALESTETVNSDYSPDLLNDLVNYYSSFDTMSSEEIWDEIVARYNNEYLANDVLESLDGYGEDFDFADEEDEYDIYGSEDLESDFNEYEDDIQEISQEFTSENTSINSKKLPAIFRMVSFEPGTINLDMGGGKFDNVADYLSEYDVTNLVYDPYNRTKEHNREVVKTIRQAGGADTATCSNVLNVIKEPEARRNVLVNMSKLVKPGGEIYITVYEGSGKGNEGPTKSGYQLNRKTADYLEEIKDIFPDAARKGKLIVATNNSSVNSSTDIQSSYNAYGDILSFICPICQNDTVYSTEKDIYHPCEIDYEELFICDECGAELKAYPKYDGTVDFIPLMDDEY